jgi:hypothetical protein
VKADVGVICRAELNRRDGRQRRTGQDVRDCQQGQIPHVKDDRENVGGRVELALAYCRTSQLSQSQSRSSQPSPLTRMENGEIENLQNPRAPGFGFRTRLRPRQNGGAGVRWRMGSTRRCWAMILDWSLIWPN